MINDKKLWKAFSEFIRRRDADENGYAKCCTCPNIRHWKSGDCGHGVPRQHWGTRYDEKNNMFQCKHCNGFEQGRQEEYAKEVDRRHGGGTWQTLLLKSRIYTKRPSQFEIDAMTKHYQELNKKYTN